MSEPPLLQAVRGMQVSDTTAAEQSESGEASASRRGPFTNGDVACVHGLNGRPDLNAEHCVLTAFHDEAGRWAVRFTSGEEVRIKTANLKHPTAPVSAETLAKLASGSEPAPTSQRRERDRQMKAKREEKAPKSLDWRMNHIDASQIEKGVAQCLSTLDVLKRKPAEPQWLIFARRSKCWMGEERQKQVVRMLASNIRCVADEAFNIEVKASSVETAMTDLGITREFSLGESIPS